VLLDYGAPLIGSAGVAAHFTPAVSSVDGIAIEWKDTGFDVGINNISFAAAAPSTVPEPGAFSPAALLLGALAIWIRRQNALKRVC